MIFSGTRIALKDTTIQDKVDSVYLPVSSGLEQALFFTAGGDGKTTRRTVLSCHQSLAHQHKICIASHSRQ